MPGLITPYLPDPPDPPVTKTEKKIARKVAVCILTLGLLVAAPTAGAATNGSNPNRVVKKVFFPKPGWEVDRIAPNGLVR